MIAASVRSLLLPSIDIATENGGIPWFPAAVGFLLGIAFLLLLDIVIPHLHASSETPEGRKSSLKKSVMLVLAVTLHSIPEGAILSASLIGTGISKKKAFGRG